MPLTPQEAASLSVGENMIARFIISAIDDQLTRDYDGSGEKTFSFGPRAGMSKKIGEWIEKQYKNTGWRGTTHFTYANGAFDITLRVKEPEKK